MKGFIVAGTMSGCGKTTIALGMMAALTARGYRVAPFKVGPDFIDPGHHQQVAGVTSPNLDGWMLSPAYNRKTFARHARSADVAVVEGVMGLYDGYDGRSEAGSTAQMAKWLGLPILLVVDARSMARSAAALVKGFVEFDREVQFAGVLFNRLGSRRHLTYLQQAVDDTVPIDCWGGVLRDDALGIPERHLGLVTRQDHPLTAMGVQHLIQVIEGHLDLDTVWPRLPEVVLPDASAAEDDATPPARVRIGVAMDNAFCFYYPDNLRLLRAAGAQLVFFSPIDDRRLPPDLDGIYLGGGYPELNAEALAANPDIRTAIGSAARQGMPIYGECGGFMYLCRELIDGAGTRHPMVGCFNIRVRMLNRLRSLGYRQITTTEPTILGAGGQTARGHEFHYSEIVDGDDRARCAYRVADRSGPSSIPTEGYVSQRVLGSYIHLHFGSQPQIPRAFVNACAQYGHQRKDSDATG